MTRWTIIEVNQNKVLEMRKTTIKESTGTSSYEAMVAAQSRAVGRLSREIASEVTNLSP